ncbi:hypothetical protein FEM08_23420 [Flavobacterium gilvum]|nr:hypothetical protein FEM08_23420 [Flavobacterium gilvum]
MNFSCVNNIGFLKHKITYHLGFQFCLFLAQNKENSLNV